MSAVRKWFGAVTSFRPLLLPLAKGLSRCLTKPLTRWNGN
jgi:hypothetical protein